MTAETVRLLDAMGGFVASMIVPMGSAFSFTGLPPGQYQLEIVALAGDPPFDPSSEPVRSAVFTLASGGTVTRRAAAIEDPGTVVGSGLPRGPGAEEDDGDLSGWTVRLVDPAGMTIASTVAGAGGSYLFTGIAPGPYQVEFIATFAGNGRGASAMPLRSAVFTVAPWTGPAAPRGAAPPQPARARRKAGAMRPVAAVPTISP